MKKILVVEDNQIVAGVYRAKLQAEGFQVEVAVDGQAGMDMIERTHPDLVLLDLIMPKMTGVEILTRLRAQTAFQTLPVIVFSSSYVSDEAWQAGATQVLNKASHSPKQVVEEVRRALAAIPPIQVAASSPLVAASTASIPLESSPATPLMRTRNSSRDCERLSLKLRPKHSPPCAQRFKPSQTIRAMQPISSIYTERFMPFPATRVYQGCLEFSG
jgi:CheY-like chemotaxis protein